VPCRRTFGSVVRLREAGVAALDRPEAAPDSRVARLPIAFLKEGLDTLSEASTRSVVRSGNEG
jgi:hypothetical protein